MSSTRHKLIAILSENEKTYISGQLLSEKLNISRSAIWKHMNELKKDGYEIEGKAKKGYRIISYPNKLSENTISWGLDTKWLGKKIIHRESVTSTQRLAHEFALDGATHGTIIIADEQTEGKGRTGKSWQSQSGEGIWLSMVLRPNIPPYLAPQLTLLTATVLAKVLDEYAEIEPNIKWPNDVLVDGKKISGILTEMQGEQDKIVYLALGMGINVNQSEIALTTDSYQATSIKMATGKEWDMVPLIQKILRTFEEKYDEYIDNGFAPVKQNWENYGFRIQEKLQIKSGKEIWEGRFLGIAEDGALLAEREDGTVKRLYSAEIEWF